MISIDEPIQQTIANVTNNNLNKTSQIQNLIQGQQNQITILWIIIILGLITAIFFIVRHYYREWFMYKVGLIYPAGIDIHYVSEITETMQIPKKDGDIYTPAQEDIKGNFMLFFAGNPLPVKLDTTLNAGTAVNKSLTSLKKSMAIEKFRSVDDFLNRYDLYFKIGAIALLIIVAGLFLIFTKHNICNLIVENKTLLTSQI